MDYLFWRCGRTKNPSDFSDKKLPLEIRASNLEGLFLYGDHSSIQEIKSLGVLTVSNQGMSLSKKCFYSAKEQQKSCSKFSNPI